MDCTHPTGIGPHYPRSTERRSSGEPDGLSGSAPSESHHAQPVGRGDSAGGQGSNVGGSLACWGKTMVSLSGQDGFGVLAFLQLCHARSLIDRLPRPFPDTMIRMPQEQLRILGLSAKSP